MTLRSIATACLTLLLATPASDVLAQSVVLDEGRFTIFLEGREAGSESFRILRDGAGADAMIVATAEVQRNEAGGSVEMRPSLRTGTDMVPQAYENKISGARVAQVSGWLDGNRFVARVSSEAGESQKEYRANARTVVLEAGVAYLYYFTAHNVDEVGATLSVVVPSTGDQYRLSVISADVEPFRFGREQLDVRHVRLEGSDQLHEIWLDDQGRVLRVEIPARGYRAERVPG